jgi:EAL domain-containing protein (putative c-di-GMP-specific phosphodiesterase class I)/GGDEF domain-containing protein
VSEGDHKYWELKAEWLKLRGYLFDPGTGLPSLPAVVDDIRRRLEDGEEVGVVYVDLSGEERLETIFGWQAYDQILRQAAGALNAFRSAVLNERDEIAISGIRGDEFLVFVGVRPPERLDERRLEQLRDKITEALVAGLSYDAAGDIPRALALSSGATLIGADPTVRLERAIYRSIDAVRARCREQRSRRHGLRVTELRRILSSGDLRVRYQPIVALDDGFIHGFEALSAGPAGDVFENPEVLFSFAEETDQIVELERLCRSNAIRGAGRLQRGQKLFLNSSVPGFVDPDLLSHGLLEDVERAGLKPTDVVFEVTERVAITEWQHFRNIVADLRSHGFSVAIDDMGAGYSSLQAVAEIEPDYLKFDISLVRDIHISPIKRNLMETLVVLAGKIDATVVAEGVETSGEYAALRDMGVALGQGYFFAAPAALEDPAPSRLHDPMHRHEPANG